MYRTEASILLLLLLCFSVGLSAQSLRLAGRVYDGDTGRPVEFASVWLAESGQWAVTDGDGMFQIKNVSVGKSTLTVQCLGYQKRTFPMQLTRDVTDMRLRLKPENLKLSEVTVVAKRKQDEATTSYTIDRQTLDQQQLLDLSDIAALLPGGKTVNPSLINDDRMALRSSGLQEKGNASFGTAIEVDGVRLDNNAAAGETMGASTRTVSASDIESVEIVTGIPSVEYGDLSNGVVKVNTRKGKSPFIVEGKLNQHTRQIALNKGFDLGSHAGGLNASFEHARSFSNAASPHTAYQRNILSLHYMNTFMPSLMPLTLNVGLTANVGGYDSDADPDEELDNYTRIRDNAFRVNASLQWLLNQPWITNLSLSGAFSYSDRRQERYIRTSSASTQPYIHTLEEGYYMAQDLSALNSSPSSFNSIILGPTGYWYEKSFADSKPLSWTLKLKTDGTRRIRAVTNRLLAGIQYAGSRNEGRGTYYDELRYTPTWREYRYDQLPTMHNLALYVEDKVIVPVTEASTFELTAGLRDDFTMIPGSDYGTVGSLSPRFNGRYVFWKGKRKQLVSDLEMHAGWGKSVKLPSFQVLYPQPAYSDLLVFASPSTADNTSYYAYHTFPSRAQYNPGLRWQYTNQTDIGFEANVKGTRLSLSVFHHRTYNAYMAAKCFTPFSYRYTSQSAAQSCGIPAEQRRFTIDRTTGTVSVSDARDALSASQPLAYTDKHTYVVNQHYENATPLDRYGMEWIIDFPTIKPLSTRLRLDGNYYYYKGIDDVLFADVPLGVSNLTSGGQPYQYVGYYRGTNVTGAGSNASASVTNGFEASQLNLNATLTTHVPKIRLIVAVRLECSLYNYRRALSQFADGGARGYMLENGSDYVGQPYDGTENKHVVVYPEYYSTWEKPGERLPFAEQFLWAKDHDAKLYSDLSQLVVRSNYAYTLNPNRLSAYCSANVSVTKEIGDHVSLSFYANNFWNTMRRVHSSQTDLETSLFGSGYVPSYYYGLSLRLKI